MDNEKLLTCLSVDEIVKEAIRREILALEFYKQALGCVGYDALSTFNQIVDQQEDRIDRLQRLSNELADLSELTGSIAD